MKKLCLLLALILGLSSLQIFLSASPAMAVTGADWKAGRIIDDAIFTQYDSMSVADIQAFLNKKVGTGGYDSVPGQCDTNGVRNAAPYNGSVSRATYAASIGKPTKWTCLSNYYEVPKTAPGPGVPANNYGKTTIPAGAKSAAQLIWDAAQQYRINPKVLLVTIHKESAGPLTTDDWPWESQYTYAMGAHCPDSGPGGTANCDPNYAGFSIQIAESAALMRWYLDSMSQPWWSYKKPGNNTILYHPNTSCGSSNVFIENKATAALYTYTPYQPNQAALNNLYGTGNSCSAYGNRNFWRIYNDWFGTTWGPPDYSCKDSANMPFLPSSPYVLDDGQASSKPDNFTLAISNNTGSACVEAHTWGEGAQNWVSNTATNHPVVDSDYDRMISGDTNGDGRDELILVKYGSTGSGKIEAHTWAADRQHWASNVATNHPVIATSSGRILAADTNGDGRDELILARYNNTASGRIEIHTWAPGQQAWVSNIATNHPAVSAANSEVIAGDINGDGRDELMLVHYRDSGSGKIELHAWNPGQQTWLSNVATNHPAVDPADGHIISANINADRRDELIYARVSHTGSGKIELHAWLPGQQSWYYNIATNHPAF